MSKNLVIRRKLLTMDFASLQLITASIFLGSGFIHSDVNKWPKNVISVLSNSLFSRLNLTPYSLVLSNTFSKVLLYSSLSFPTRIMSSLWFMHKRYVFKYLKHYLIEYILWWFCPEYQPFWSVVSLWCTKCSKFSGFVAFRSILQNTLHPLRWYVKSSMLDSWTYLFLFIYLFVLACIMFGCTLLHSLIAYLGFGWTTKGEHHVMASFWGTFSKIPPASPCSIHFLSGDSWWYDVCLTFSAIGCIPAFISNPTSMTSLV